MKKVNKLKDSSITYRIVEAYGCTQHYDLQRLVSKEEFDKVHSVNKSDLKTEGNCITLEVVKSCPTCHPVNDDVTFGAGDW